MNDVGATTMRSLSIGLAGAAQSASATTDTKDYPGMMCMLERATGVGGRLAISSQGAVFVTGTTSDVIVVCPIVLDLKRISSVQVQVINNNGTVECGLLTMRSDGSIQDRALVSASLGAGKKQISFPGQESPSTSAGSYVMECSIPGVADGKSAGILMYRVTESD